MKILYIFSPFDCSHGMPFMKIPFYTKSDEIFTRFLGYTVHYTKLKSSVADTTLPDASVTVSGSAYFPGTTGDKPEIRHLFGVNVTNPEAESILNPAASEGKFVGNVPAA